MQPWIAIVLATALTALAQQTETLPTSPTTSLPVPVAKGTWRLSAGLGGGTFGLVGLTRAMIGPEGTDWRFGAQMMHMKELRFFTSPTEDVSSFQFLAGREMSPAGPFSATLFAGGGMAESELRGRLLTRSMMSSTYETIRSTDPCLVAGVDVGLSFRRHIGLSLQLGAHVSRVTAAYIALQFDAGSW